MTAPTQPAEGLPELPAIQRYTVVGDIAYPIHEDPEGSVVDYDDHVAAMRAYAREAIATVARERDELREALRPLAGLDLRPDAMDERPDDSIIYSRNKSRITVGDVKRARAALGGDGE